MPNINMLRKQISKMTGVYTPNQIAYILAGIDLAEAKLKEMASTRPARIKRPTAALMNIQQWEEKQGCLLNYSMITKWVRAKEFCPVLISEMIEEFRLAMISKDKQYADFAAAFQNYVNSGYLSKKAYQLHRSKSPYTPSQYHGTRGVNL